MATDNGSTVELWMDLRGSDDTHGGQRLQHYLLNGKRQVKGTPADFCKNEETASTIGLTHVLNPTSVRSDVGRKTRREGKGQNEGTRVHTGGGGGVETKARKMTSKGLTTKGGTLYLKREGKHIQRERTANNLYSPLLPIGL